MLCSVGLVASTQGVCAQEPQESSPETEQSHEPDTRLSRYRSVFEALTERAIGRTTRRVRYDWRRSTVQFGAHFGVPAELNNYDSLRAGAKIRVPSGNLLLSLDLSYVWVQGSTSSRLLALTPYRQPGRPSRWELDFGVRYPLAEGVMTASYGLVPPTELVFSLLGNFRYLVYPGGYRGLGLGDTLTALIAPRLSNEERNNLDTKRLPGMKLDPARYGVLTGLGTDLYFQSGVFLSVETLVAVPLFATVTNTEMLFSLELNLSVGLSL